MWWQWVHCKSREGGFLARVFNMEPLMLVPCGKEATERGGVVRRKPNMKNMQKSCLSWQRWMVAAFLTRFFECLLYLFSLDLHREGQPRQDEEPKLTRLSCITTAS